MEKKNKFTIILLIFTSSICFSQEFNHIPDSLIRTEFNLVNPDNIESSCVTANGPMNSTSITPPNYTWLQSNGYCNPASYGKNGTVCWTFTPSADSVNVNSGFITNCSFVSFSTSKLYTCSPLCVNVGSGLTFTVTPGVCYTWCLNYSGFGGSCSFSDFCPYFMQSTAVLPIELSYFAGSSQESYNLLKWQTITEINNDYFIIEKSLDAQNWFDLAKIKSAGNSLITKNYEYSDRSITSYLTYYRLKQVDYNGAATFFGIIAINTEINTLQLIRAVDVLGQSVDENYKGIMILYYSDGSIRKKISN